MSLLCELSLPMPEIPVQPPFEELPEWRVNSREELVECLWGRRHRPEHGRLRLANLIKTAEREKFVIPCAGKNCVACGGEAGCPGFALVFNYDVEALQRPSHPYNLRNRRNGKFFPKSQFFYTKQ